MKRKLLALLIAALMTVGVLPLSVFAVDEPTDAVAVVDGTATVAAEANQTAYCSFTPAADCIFNIYSTVEGSLDPKGTLYDVENGELHQLA